MAKDRTAEEAFAQASAYARWQVACYGTAWTTYEDEMDEVECSIFVTLCVSWCRQPVSERDPAPK